MSFHIESEDQVALGNDNYIRVFDLHFKVCWFNSTMNYKQRDFFLSDKIHIFDETEFAKRYSTSPGKGGDKKSARVVIALN